MTCGRCHWERLVHDDLRAIFRAHNESFELNQTRLHAQFEWPDSFTMPVDSTNSAIWRYMWVPATVRIVKPAGAFGAPTGFLFQPTIELNGTAAIASAPTFSADPVLERVSTGADIASVFQGFSSTIGWVPLLAGATDNAVTPQFAGYTSDPYARMNASSHATAITTLARMEGYGAFPAQWIYAAAGRHAVGLRSVITSLAGFRGYTPAWDGTGRVDEYGSFLSEDLTTSQPNLLNYTPLSRPVGCTGPMASFIGKTSVGSGGYWNAYMSGNAPNAFAGKVRVGSTVVPTLDMHVTGSIGWKVRSTAATETLQVTDGTVLHTATTNQTLTLPSAANAGHKLHVIRTATGGTLTIQAGAGDTLAGGSVALTIIRSSAYFVSDGGTTWYRMQLP